MPTPSATANWVTGELTAWLRHQEPEVTSLPIDGAGLAVLVGLVGSGGLSSSAGKEVLEGVLAGEGSAEVVAEARNLIQITDTSELDSVVAAVIAANPKAIEGFRNGEEKIVGFLVGQVMRETGGRADPRLADQLIRARLTD